MKQGFEAFPELANRVDRDTPRRVQLSRTKGWRMPPNTVKVDRTTMWGNRWQIGTHSNLLGREVRTVKEAVMVYAALMWPEDHHVAWVREKLGGKNLACWCKLGEPCHADVLLQLANPGEEPPSDHTGRNGPAVPPGTHQVTDDA